MRASAARRRPNVLVILPDDHQADAFGVVGHPVVQTPVLDALARRGTRLSQATIQGGLNPAVCAPTRASLLTGLDFVRSNASPSLEVPEGGHVTIPGERILLPELFRTYGYETFIAGKWHNDLNALRRGFESGRAIFHGGMCDHERVPVRDLDEIRRGDPPRFVEGFSTEIFCDAMGQFLEERDTRRPFFAWLALTSPHDPRTPPADIRCRYRDEAIPLPPNFRPEPAFDNGELDVRDEQLAPKPLDPAVLRQHLGDYYGMITHHDREIGRVLSVLERSGELEDTIVVYIGDHGLALGRHGLLGKQNMYQHSITVPWIMAGPGVPEGVVVDTPVYALDLFSTLAELARLDWIEPVSSQSAVPLMRDPSCPGREYVCSVYRDCQRAVREGRWKLIEYFVDGRRRTELFDLENDPHEMHDLSGEAGNACLLWRLRSAGVRWQAVVGDRWMPISLETK
ncbi:MAG: sulfatase [Verrucomicrobia bacterium]|nr:MAG: sulfatase [Verrucomicrobiota bacterium]